MASGSPRVGLHATLGFSSWFVADGCVLRTVGDYVTQGATAEPSQHAESALCAWGWARVPSEDALFCVADVSIYWCVPSHLRSPPTGGSGMRVLVVHSDAGVPIQDGEPRSSAGVWDLGRGEGTRVHLHQSFDGLR